MRDLHLGDVHVAAVMAEPIVRCKDCRSWQTGIAYVVTGRCTNENMPEGLICNANFFCGWGAEKE